MSQPDWTSSTLAELAESKALVFSDGYRTRADQFASEGIPILRAADVADGILIPAHSDHIRTDFRPKIGNKTTRARDVVLTTKGTVGRAAMVPDGFPEHAYSPQLCFFRVKDTATLDAGYLYGWIRSTECRSQLFASKDLTDMAPYVNLRDLSQFRITLPPLSEQWRIAGVLSAFDDLIETNRNLACSQEALARVLASRGDDEVAVEEIAEVPPRRQRRPTG
ncbi:MAG: restriction endonuclease subunit S, partial [Propionicimonas sp.]|nr:restriction endonuclease subunit S [Propionicimonas sp.]